jgi:hypothetical protein
MRSMDMGLNAFDYDAVTNRLIVGTRGNEIYELQCNVAGKKVSFVDVIT